ncbi:MAG TPA: hypothetical protein VIL58_04390 [Thermoplasmata archaeon]
MRVFGILIIGLALLATSTANAQFLFGPFPPVLITINPPNPRAGDTLTVDVYTFAAGRLADADTVPEARFYSGGQSTPLESFRRFDRGHHQGLIRLPLSSSSGQARDGEGYVQVTGNLSGMPFLRYATVSWFDPGLYIRLSINNTSPVMGESVTIRAELYNRSDPVDADNITFLVDILSDTPFHLEPPPRRVAMGAYEAQFTVPMFFPAYRVVIVNAIAQKSGSEIRAGFDTHVALYQLWFHRTFINSTDARGEFWIADASGRPAPDVAIHFLWGYTGTCCIPVDGSTDAGGRFPIALTYPPATHLNIAGSVGSGTPMEDFFGLTLWTSDQPTSGVKPLDPPLMPDGSTRDFLRPGARVTRAYQLLNVTFGGAEPFSNAPADFYIWTSQRIIGSGNTMTDGNGGMTVSFVVPEEDVVVGFIVGPHFVDNVYYRTGSPLVGLNVSSLTLGGTTSVRASVRGDLQASVDARFVGFSQSSITLLTPAPGERWERWTRALGDDLYSVVGGRGRSYSLPTFLPADGKYLVAVSVSTGSQRLTQFTVLSVGQAAEIPIGSAFPREGGEESGLGVILVTLAISAVAAAAVAIAIFLRRGRQPPKASPRR